MHQLLLLRHAKSSWDDASLPDRERSLNKRGRRAAAAMREAMRGLGLAPDVILVSPAIWELTLKVNITAPFLLIQNFSCQMPPGSSVVNILSVAAKTGFAGWSAYCMSKFALEGFSQSVREELREHKIRVINIYPAATDTEIWNNVDGDWPRKNMISAKQVADAVGYAIAQPSSVLVENITLGNLTGNL